MRPGTTTARLVRWVREQYDEAHAKQCFEALARMAAQGSLGGQQSERMQMAVLLHAKGDPSRLAAGVALAGADFRDVLIGTGLEHSDWRRRLDALLGPMR